MKKSKFIDTQIVSILKEADAGIKVTDICRKHGISEPTYCNWKSKYGGMSVTELKRVKELEAEHSKLKCMYADLASFRNEVLYAHVFASLGEVREHVHHWLISYNEERPHESLGNILPALFRQQ